MILKVNPNRMELLRLKRRLQLARKGHKLLKDKQEDLIKRLVTLIKELAELRRELDELLNSVYRDMMVSKACMGTKLWKSVLSGMDLTVDISTGMVPVMNLRLPEYEYQIKGDIFNYTYAGTPGSFDDAVNGLKKMFPLMIMIAQKEKWIFLISKELEKTRRRVNALEYILIPNLEDTIKFINMKLSELERGNIVRLLKMKDFVR